MNDMVHAPHAHAPASVGRTMATVMAALAPATLYGFWLYGWPSVLLWAVTLASALLAEAFSLVLMRRPVKPALMDGSALLAAWILALSLPPWAAWWVGAVGALFAVVVVKQVFGGLGQNVFNPAMAARVMLLISFPVDMTQWIAPVPLTSAHAPGLLTSMAITFGSMHMDAVTSATLLGHVKTDFTRGLDLLHSLPGHFDLAGFVAGSRAGSLGETSAALLLAGGLFLIARRIVTWQGPVAMLLGVALPALIAHALAPAHFLGMLPELTAGGLILGAFFIVTDPVTSPNTGPGMFLFGLGCGLLTWIIRSFGGYPEGVAFAIMLMNALTPIIDRYVRPRVYGRTARGEPLPLENGGR